MFERFTDRARRVVVLAQEEARPLGHNYIGTEHILLGLVREGEGVGAKALESLGISLGRVHSQVEAIVGRTSEMPLGHIPFTPRAKKVLELSLREALELGHNYIGTEHILLGLIREGEGVGAQVLVQLGADLERVRAMVIHLLSGYSGGQPRTDPSLTFASPDPASTRALLVSGPHGAGCALCGRDVWELDRYVTRHGVLICDVCVEAAQRVIASTPPTEGRGLSMPPLVFGSPPDADAVDELASAIEAVFGHGDDTECARVLEDGERLAPLRAEAARRFPMYAQPSAQLDRVRFDADDRAELRIAVIPQEQTTGLMIDGHAVRRGDRWFITRETFCQVMQRAGVPCPPPEKPEV